MKIVPAVLLSTVAVVGTAVGATAANFAVLSDHGSLHGNTNFGGIAPAAEDHQNTKRHPNSQSTPLPSSTAAINQHQDVQRHHSTQSGVPAPWVTDDSHDDGANSDPQTDDSDQPVAVPTTNKPEVTLTTLPTKTPKPHKTEKQQDDEETEAPDQSDDDD